MIVTAHQTVSLHTHSGIQLYQFRPEQQQQLSWGREAKETSQCQVTLSAGVDDGRLLDIDPWVHWLSVWDTEAANPALLWTGPIQKPVISRDTITITARDVSVFGARTRMPLTKRWDAADPSTIALELWNNMVEAHALSVHPIARPDPEGDPFDFNVEKDAKMVDETISDLVNLGLKWTVVAGVPILGPAPLDPIAALDENDFPTGGITLTRDGSATFNDVLLRAADNIAQTRVPIEGMNLQTIVHVDDMFGVTNADRAVKQYARHTAAIRDVITLPDNSVLHPDAPVVIDNLIPSTRFALSAYGRVTLQELRSVSVECSKGKAAVSVTMESVVDLPELAKFSGITS